MDINNIGLEIDQSPGLEYCILVKTAIFGLIKNRTKAVGEQEEFYHVDDLVSCGAAQDCDFDLPKPLTGQQGSPQGSALRQYVIDGARGKIEHIQC